MVLIWTISWTATKKQNKQTKSLLFKPVTFEEGQTQNHFCPSFHLQSLQLLVYLKTSANDLKILI